MKTQLLEKSDATVDMKARADLLSAVFLMGLPRKLLVSPP
jgi:hypothetical protein